MRTCYANLEERAVIDLVPPGELMPCWTITRVNVPVASRGRGVASELLTRVLRDADREGKTLALQVQAGDDEGLTDEQLESWYIRHGFRRSQRWWPYLVRRAAQVR